MHHYTAYRPLGLQPPITGRATRSVRGFLCGSLLIKDLFSRQGRVQVKTLIFPTEPRSLSTKLLQNQGSRFCTKNPIASLRVRKLRKLTKQVLVQNLEP